MDADATQVQPFIRPKLPRKVIAARVRLLEDTIHELRMQGADAGQLEPVERSLEDARREVRLAGGATDGGLRTAIMAEGRKLAKREAAIAREETKRGQLQREVDEAIARVARHDTNLDQLRDKLEYSRERYAYLVSQQAAEGQRAPRADAVHKACAAISEIGAGLGEEIQGHIKLVSDAVSLVFGGARIDGKEAFAGVWIDSESDGCEAEDDEDERDLDDEPEVTGEMLQEVHQAGSALRAARVERNKALLEACRAGTALTQKTDNDLRAKIRTSVEALVVANARRDAARELAKKRIEAEEAEARRREARRAAEETEKAAAETAAAASIASMAGAGTGAGVPRSGQGDRDCGEAEAGRRGRSVRADGSADDTPCPPPAKWRRAASEESERTVEEEEEVPQLGMAVDEDNDRSGGIKGSAAGAEDVRGGVAGRERGWEDQQRVERGAKEVDAQSAPRGIHDALADGALGIVRAAMAGGARRRVRTLEPVRSRSPAR